MFKEYEFVVDGLSDWLGLSGIRVIPNRDFKGGVIEYGMPEPISHKLSDELDLEFGFAGTYPSGLLPTPPTEVSITQKPLITLTSETARDIDYFNELASKLSRFMSIAIDQDAHIQSVNVVVERQPSNSYVPPKRRVSVYRPFFPKPKQGRKISSLDLLFDYHDIRNGFEEVINNWIGNCESDTFLPVINLYRSSRTMTSLSLDTRFLYLCQGIEILHRKIFPNEKNMDKKKFRNVRQQIILSLPADCPNVIKQRIGGLNELSLRDRIRHMMRGFENWFDIDGGAEEFAKKVATTRNFLTHFSSGLEDKAAKGQELWELFSKLEILVLLHILDLIGFNEQEIATVAQRPIYRFSRELRVNDD